MSFWGVYLKPNDEPYTLPYNQNHTKILRITQATLGDAIRTSPARSTVNCSIGDKPEIAICSLSVPHLTCCQLDLEFHESHDVIFSVKGPRGIHLAGYFVTPAADHLRLMNNGNEVLNGDEVPEKTQCGLLQENGDETVKKKKKRSKKNKKKKASTIESTASGYVSDTQSNMLKSRLTKKDGSTNALERSEDKVKAKREASTIEPMAIGNVSVTEDDKFGSESRIIKENCSTNALERGEDKEEKKNRKRKASTIEPTASGYVSPTEDDKFGSESRIIKENGSTNALERGEDKEKKKNRKRKASTTDSGYVSPTKDDKFGSESIIIKENGSNALEKNEDTLEKKKKKKRRKKSISKHNLSNDKNASTGDRYGDSPSLTIEGELLEMSKTILVECEVKGAGAKSK